MEAKIAARMRINGAITNRRQEIPKQAPARAGRMIVGEKIERLALFHLTPAHLLRRANCKSEPG